MEKSMFKKVTPESCGIDSKYVEKFISQLEKRKIHMHSVMLCRGYDIFGEFYWAPFNKDFLHRMYSETKSYVSIAIGFLFAKLFQAVYNWIETGEFNFYKAGITVMGGLIGGAGAFLLFYFVIVLYYLVFFLYCTWRHG
jgi:hypothetical protein